MKVSYNITQNKFNVSFKTGYYPLPVGLENYYTKNETDLLLENYYLKNETYSQNEVDSLFLNETLDTVTERGNTTANEITVGGLTTKYVQLDTTSVNSYSLGKVYWNADKGTYNFGLKNNVELQLGQEQHVYGKAYSAITNGQLVMYRTSQGGHILFEPANFTQLSANPDLIIGVATQDIALNEFGYITTFGEVNTLNTSSFADGNTLYFGIGNVLQNAMPSGSYFIIGRVNRAHATQGSIFVKPYFVDSTKISGSGTENYVSKFTASGTVGNSIVYDNGTNLGISRTSPSEKLDVNGYTKAFGFKVAGGTANQALTANGSVFDLNTKADLVGGKIPSTQLPSYVDDVLEFANLASFPATGENGKIYIAIDTNITYRWTGSNYIEISASLALGETSSTAYRGDRGKTAYDHSQTTGNPHNTTKADIGLGNVDNTSDLNKPISNATQLALNGKQNLLTNPITGTGTTNRISKFTASGTVGDSQIFDNGSNVGIGAESTSARLDIRAQGSNTTDIAFRVRNSTNTADFFYVNGAGEVHVSSGNFTVASTNPQFFFKRASTSNSSRVQFMTGSTYNFSLGLRGGDSNFHIFDETAGADRVVLGTNGVMTVNAGLKDQYGTLKSQRTITITGDITLSETHNGAVLNVTNTCNITIPTGLDANFQCRIFAKGSIIVTFVNGGVTVYAPSGLLLKTDKMASLISTSANNFNLTGELVTT